MRESDLLRHIAERSPLKALGPGVVVGPGDDCAVLAASSRDLLVTVDHLVEGRHFAAGTPVDAIARKAVARSVSDIAAMAGTPAWGLATGALPPEWMAGGKADELFDRMAHWARHWHCPLVGGDITSMPEGSPLVLTVTVAGHVHGTRGAGGVLRSGACAGDAVWVTGRIGGSLAGGGGRHLTFEPRVAEGRWLADTLGEDLHAMIDVSDGLGRDAGRIAAASGVRIEIERARVPLHADAGETALADGEDYELVFTTAAGAELPASCPVTGVPLTRIGRVVNGSGCGVIEADGRVVEGAELGWDH